MNLFYLLSILKIVSGKIVLIVDENYELCQDGDPAVFDVSKLIVTQHNDTYTYVEGTIKALQNIKSPAVVAAFAERQIKGKWERSMIDRKVPDFCSLIQNPAEVWYFVTKNLNIKECPFKAGDILTAGRVEISESQIELQSFMIGEWRLTVNVEIHDKLKVLKDCYRVYYTVAEL
ncbi:unnamed protein product [Diamesa serratosioi]